jgi:ATP-dependent RNA helicase DeaD
LFRKLIEDYERDHDVPTAEIAAALAVQSRGGGEFLMTEPPPEKRRERPDRDSADGPPRKRRDNVRSDLATYRIAVGKRHKVGPGSIVGAIANEGGWHRSDFGHITIKMDHSTVELPAKLSKETLKKLENTRISGVLIDLKQDRPGREGPSHHHKPK